MGAWLEWRGLIRPNEHAAHRGFWCPACRTLHVMDERWTFDGNYESPTFTPSLSSKTGHYVGGAQLQSDGKCGICESAKERGVRSICCVCHLNLTAGQIIFHADCTHELAGRTVPMTRPPEQAEDG